MSSLNLSNTISNTIGSISVPGSQFVRYAPEPRSAGGFWSQASNAFSFVSSTLGNLTAVPGAEQFQALLQEQMRVQMVMQVVSMQSNLLKSQHETEMAAVRNMRVG
jgi:hypothetical protein